MFFTKCNSLLRLRSYWRCFLFLHGYRRLPPPLYCLICGYERSGTTVVSELIHQSPGIEGRFEGGFLLSSSPAEFARLEPYAANLKIAWGLNDQALSYICGAASWAEMYMRLLERANISDKTAMIYDKAPRYMQYLRNVLGKVDVPCVVVVKDPRALYWSHSKREKAEPKSFCHYYLLYANEFKAALRQFPRRILLVRYEELCTIPEREAERIYNFLGLQFLPEYVSMPKEGDPYVAPGGINNRGLNDYKNNVPLDVQKFIVEQTAEFSCWHWHDGD